MGLRVFRTLGLRMSQELAALLALDAQAPGPGLLAALDSHLRLVPARGIRPSRSCSSILFAKKDTHRYMYNIHVRMDHKPYTL